MRVLVTGATGMLGRATALALVGRGDDVTVLQRRPSGLPLPEVLGDVADPDAVRAAVRGCDAVVHLAAKVDVVGRWSDYRHANIEGTRTVVAACRAAGVGRLVQVSSPSVAHAGRSLVGVGAEPADPVHARGPHARSKAVSEVEALAADGPRPRGPGRPPAPGLGTRRHPAGGPDRGPGPGPTAPVLGSGAALIDTTYVDNAASALVGADACGAVQGEALVVSNGEPRPVREVLARLCAAAGVPAPTRQVPPAAARLVGAAVEGVWAAGRRPTPRRSPASWWSS